MYVSGPYHTLSFCCEDCCHFDRFYTCRPDDSFWPTDYGQCLLEDAGAPFPLYCETDICDRFIECAHIPWPHG